MVIGLRDRRLGYESGWISALATYLPTYLGHFGDLGSNGLFATGLSAWCFRVTRVVEQVMRRHSALARVRYVGGWVPRWVGGSRH